MPYTKTEIVQVITNIADTLDNDQDGAQKLRAAVVELRAFFDLEKEEWDTVRIALARAYVDMQRKIKRAQRLHELRPNSRAPRPSELAMEAADIHMVYKKVEQRFPKAIPGARS